MDAGVIVALVIAAVALIALLVLLGPKTRERRLDAKREQARKIHRESEVLDARAERRRAEADRAAAEAREQSAAAERESEAARERRERAEEVHPDDEPEFREYRAGRGRFRREPRTGGDRPTERTGRFRS